MLTYNDKLKRSSRQLRNNMTNAETRLWAKLRLRQIRGFWFYRQKPIGEYIVDFFCPKAKLVIEVDGGQHFSGDAPEYDAIRDGYLKSLGLKVLRFTNNEVLNIEGVVERIVEAL
jgi:very-short-patch-repair endonuclease